MCSDALDIAFEITKLVKFSTKRNMKFDKIILDNEDGLVSGMSVRMFCTTR